MRRLAAILIGLLTLVGQPTSAAAGTISELVVFGDSLCDVGNSYQAEPYSNGRYSNGPIWVSRFSQLVGLTEPPTRSSDGGTNYAYGGAETGSGSSWKDTPNIGEQIHTYLDVDKRTPSNTTLVILWGGANDIFEALFDEEKASAAATSAVVNLGAHIETLADAGATQFLVPDLPPLGSTPMGIQFSGLVGFWNPLCVDFNTALAAELNRLRSTRPVMIEGFDTHGVFMDAIADPSAYGLTNVKDRAMTAAAQGKDINGYLFWDDVHPTTYGHRILADAMAIPEPGPITLLLSAGLVLVLSGRRSGQAIF